MNTPLMAMVAMGILFSLSGLVFGQGVIRLKAEDVLAQEERLNESLDDVDRRIALLIGQLGEVQSREKSYIAKVKQLEEGLETVGGELKELRIRIRERLRARARMNLDEVAWRKLLLTDLASNRVLRTRGYVASILRSDLELMSRFSEELLDLDRLKAEKTVALGVLEDVKAELDERRLELEEERSVKNHVVRVLRTERRLLRRWLRATRVNRANLTIQDVDGGLGLYGRRGSLPMPTDGDLAVSFGRQRDPALKTTVFSNGWSIDAKPGSPVRAIFDGDIVFSGWYSGFGNLVIVDHGAGHHTLYAHLQSLEKARGARVAQGDLLGGVGETGSLRGPHLYFELRIKKRPVNPRYWIKGNQRKP